MASTISTLGMKKIDVSLISLRPEKDHEEKRKREGSQMVGTGEFTSPRRGRRGIDVTRSANPLLFLSIDREKRCGIVPHLTWSGAMGAQKEGHPVPESNFALESKRGSPDTALT